MELFNPEKRMLMPAKDVQKKIDNRIPEFDFTDILNDIQSFINKYINEKTSDKLRIRLYDNYLDDMFKKQGVSFLKQGYLLMPVLVGLLDMYFGYEADYVNNLHDSYLNIELPDKVKEEYDGEAVRAHYKKVHSTK